MKIIISDNKINPICDFHLGLTNCFKWHAIYQPKQKKGYILCIGHGKTPTQALQKLLKLPELKKLI